MEDKFYTVPEFAKIFKLSQRAIRKAITSGRIRAFKVNTGIRAPYRIPSTELIRIQQIGMWEVNPSLQSKEEEIL